MKKKVLIGISLAVMGVVTAFSSNAKAELSLADQNIKAVMLNDEFDCEVYCEEQPNAIFCLIIYNNGESQFCPSMRKCPYLEEDNGENGGQY